MQIPYLVLGNYDLRAEHPCYKVDIINVARRLMNKRFAKFSGKKVTAFLGPITQQADRELAQAVRLVFRELGICGANQELVINCLSNGYEEICRLMNSPSPPEVIYIHGIQALGWNKYCQSHPEKPRPLVIINERDIRLCNDNIYDETLNFTLWDDNDRRAVARQLVEMVEKRSKTTESPPLNHTPFSDKN